MSRMSGLHLALTEMIEAGEGSIVSIAQEYGVDEDVIYQLYLQLLPRNITDSLYNEDITKSLYNHRSTHP